MPVPPWLYVIYEPVGSKGRALGRVKTVHECGRQFTRPWASAGEVAVERMAVHAYPILRDDPAGAALAGLVCRVWRRGEEDRPGYAYGNDWVNAARRRAA